MTTTTMTVTEVRRAIRDAGFIFVRVGIYPTRQGCKRLKIGKWTAQRLFSGMDGDEAVVADYDVSTPEMTMLFIG